MMKKLVVFLAIALLGSGCGTGKGPDIPPEAEKTPATAATGPTGRIRGVVRARGDIPAAAFDTITENQNICALPLSDSA